MPPFEWIEKIIAIDSVTDRSNLEVISFLRPLIEKSGLKLEIQEHREKDVSFYNLTASSHSKTGLVFHTHLDTVAPGDLKLWTKTKPFKAKKVGNKIYGLGSADVKIDFLCKLWAAMRSSPWVKPITLVGTYGEERGLVGAKKLFEGPSFKPTAALIGEPSNLELVVAHKGHLVFEVKISLNSSKGGKKKSFVGKAAHSSTPNLGVNAIEKALQWVVQNKVEILSLEGGQSSNAVPQRCEIRYREGKPSSRLQSYLSILNKLKKEYGVPKNKAFSPATTTLSTNLATDHSLVFDVRVLPEVSIGEIRDEIEFQLHTHHLPYQILSEDPPMKGDPAHPFIELCKKALRGCKMPAKIKTKASSTEGAIYSQKNVPAAIFGPGLSIGNVHRPNEHSLADQIAKAVRFYELMMQIPGEI